MLVFAGLNDRVPFFVDGKKDLAINEGDVIELTCAGSRQFDFIFLQNYEDIVSMQ